MRKRRPPAFITTVYLPYGVHKYVMKCKPSFSGWIQNKLKQEFETNEADKRALSSYIKECETWMKGRIDTERSLGIPPPPKRHLIEQFIRHYENEILNIVGKEDFIKMMLER